MPFFSFWWKVFCRAADRAWCHFNFLLGLAAIGSGLSVLGFFVQLAKKEGVDVNYWLLLVPVILFGSLFIWRLATAPFEIYTENQEEIKILVDKLAQIENEKIVLDVEFLEPTIPDPATFLPTFRVRIINRHTTKTATRVTVSIKNFECPEGEELERAKFLQTIGLPYDLPAKGGRITASNANAYDVRPYPNDKIFDSFFIIKREKKTTIGMAPFHPPIAFGATALSRFGEFTLNGDFDGTGFHDSAAKGFTITFLIGCDGIKPFPKEMTLRIPAFGDEHAKPTWNETAAPA